MWDVMQSLGLTRMRSRDHKTTQSPVAAKDITQNTSQLELNIVGRGLPIANRCCALIYCFRFLKCRFTHESGRVKIRVAPFLPIRRKQARCGFPERVTSPSPQGGAMMGILANKDTFSVHLLHRLESMCLHPPTPIPSLFSVCVNNLISLRSLWAGKQAPALRLGLRSHQSFHLDFSGKPKQTCRKITPSPELSEASVSVLNSAPQGWQRRRPAAV